jgi:site-specific recombinase XerD
LSQILIATEPTFEVVALEREMPLDVVQQLLGHTSAATTAIYTRVQERRLAHEAIKLER